MPLRTRLLAGFALIILLVGSVGFFAHTTVQESIRISVDVEQATKISQASLDFNVENFHTQLEVWEHVYEPSEERLNAFASHNDKLTDLLDELVRLVAEETQREQETGRRKALCADGKQEIDEVVSSLNRVRAGWIPLFEGIEDLRSVAAAGYGEGSERYEELEAQVKNLAIDNELLFDELEFNEKVDHFVASQQTLVTNLEEEQRTRLSELGNTLVLAMAIMVALGALAALSISLSISRPIEKLQAMALEVGKGDLDVRVEVDSKDEIGVLAASLNQMAGDLKGSRDEIIAAKTYVENIIKSMSETLIVLTPEGTIQVVNQATCDLLGYQAEELVGRPMDLIVAEEARKLIEKDANKGIERLYLTKSGNRIPVLFSCSVMRSSDGETQGIVCLASDISARKRAETALRESEEKLARSLKMESLGLLAGGVAHDLNNVLAGIVGYPELLLLKLPGDSPLRAPIERIRETGNRAAAVVQDLLTVARGVAIAKKPLQLNALVTEYLSSPEFQSIQQRYPAVSVRTELDSDLLNVLGSDTHLRKALMNLVLNAVEATEGSGEVVLSTTNRHVDRPTGRYVDVGVGEYAVLTVEDNGTGIAQDDLDRIFEPFYTKKVMGKSGTGLGLAVAWNVAQDLNGYIDVSGDDRGTTFELYLPITRREIQVTELPVPIEEYKGSGESVLVVDDVESQREITCSMLNVLGYEAKAVTSGEEAVEYLKGHTADLIVLDMIMDPGMNGRETYEKILEIHPNQKAVIASGFAETEDVEAAETLGVGKYIKKPLTLEKLGLAVRDELRNPSVRQELAFAATPDRYNR